MAKIIMICILVLKLLIPDTSSMLPGPITHIASGKLQDGSPKYEKIFEQLVKNDTLAYTIWNITKEYNITLSLDKCVTELEKWPNLVSFYIVNTSLEATEEFLTFYSNYENFHIRHSLKHGRMLYQKRAKVIENQELYIETVKRIVQTGREENDIICASGINSTCGCFPKDSMRDNEETLIWFKSDNEHLWEFITFGTYLDPAFRIIIMIVGLAINSVMLFIFFNEKTIRTESNVLIFNLIINNIFMLMVYLPTNYVTIYHAYEMRESRFELLVGAQFFVVSANAVIILLINIQRYFDISRILNTNNPNTRLTPTHRCIIYSSVIWIFCSGVAFIFEFVHPYNARSLQVLINFMLYVFIFSIVMALFNSMTARKLQRSAEQGHAPLGFENLTGSAVILHLTFVYYVTHLLYYIFTLFEGPFFDSGLDYFSAISIRIVILILHLIFFSYPCLTVLALYKSSGAYRSFLKFYLFRCWYNPEGGPYVTTNTGENAEAQRLCE